MLPRCDARADSEERTSMLTHWLPHRLHVRDHLVALSQSRDLQSLLALLKAPCEPRALPRRVLQLPPQRQHLLRGRGEGKERRRKGRRERGRDGGRRERGREE
eukprot:1465382-Rhodomonas_salina.1